MENEAQTLYKLMIMHMLHKVNFPLTNSQVTDFFVKYEYTQYFVVQTALNDLKEVNLIAEETIGNSTRFELTPEGEETLSYFNGKISDEIKNDITEYIAKNKFKFRSEIGIIAEYYRSSTQDYIVHCEIREGKISIFDMKISVPTLEQAENVCDKWKKENQTIYAYLMQKLL